MRAQRTQGTGPEIALRRELHRRGFRFYVHRQPLPQLRRVADLVFPRARLAVFVDGCFWHYCPSHGSLPATNHDWWQSKLEGNRRRDRDTDRRLEAAGWAVVRVWEHESPSLAADRVATALATKAT